MDVSLGKKNSHHYQQQQQQSSPTINSHYYTFVWLWMNLILLVLYGCAGVSSIVCQIIFNDDDQWMLSTSIGLSIQSVFIVINLLSSLITRYKMKYRQQQQSSKNAFSDKSIQPSLVLIYIPILFLISCLVLTLVSWFVYSNILELATDRWWIIIISLHYILIAIMIFLEVFSIKPYPLLISSHNIDCLP
ncbi:uncharacterized protein BX664DRAFT_326241 [Halteromyces radiatus]|uniref:uncharacterized protein n=1 Tax=Halteromyces radiatus TaxID=101107 RepID=UPI0022204868|nr:uncharacterized protein BX664DRAFT_326241 [Halteromyces radiatus]KAI8097381.1 hypothetical protein BX664DRAFT_326241 [Halteromyces radiatus]